MFFQVETHVQIACQSPDLNMVFVHLTMGVNSYTNRHICKYSLFERGLVYKNVN